MTDQQKEVIANLREKGEGYITIAKNLGMCLSAVKSYCQRHGLGKGYPERRKEEAGEDIYCKHCRAELTHTPGAKRKKFCSNKCRAAWWNAHPERVDKKAWYEVICSHCGKQFHSYGNRRRKYCSHKCYIDDRFPERRPLS
jgi:endogenous inhibitor of DNA gyrase (YacG/DUF329 family)